MLTKLQRRLNNLQYIRAMREKLGDRGEPLREFENRMLLLAKLAMKEEEIDPESERASSQRPLKM